MSTKFPPDYDWHAVSHSLPEIAVIVWVSKGGGTCLLARYYRHRRAWEGVDSRVLCFSPVFWQYLRLPEPPPAAQREGV